MQLTISSDEPLEHVLEAVGALFGVRLAVEPEALDAVEDDRSTKTRH